ncbi:HAMP domain-containing sensor histidine kinase [Pseudonocardia sp. N23]|uniref:sensor histidine kinase n=1 Tax=Pseudonocardia sp. N23 TaxID=1987376 RepID=UPI000BFC0B70|nr:HAMP domain-containing sensor histidine kinase [Pseudonocardia sp. N23]GAY13188.1 probable two-component sensor kinase [Pseudonocardia sp. N23]
MTRLRRWWTRRSLRFRITLAVGVVAVVALVLLSRLGAGLVASTLTGAADAELRAQADSVAATIRTGGAADGGPAVRVVDTAGAPADGRPPLPLGDGDVRRLASGAAITTFAAGEFRRWLAVPAVVPDGSTRLVVASGTLVGGATLLARAAVGFLLAALVVAGVIALAAWAATRAALRPVDRMRASAAALPPGQRLPLPESRDELRALAEEINSLLARRDEAVTRLERFTGDAAHELRSPVASIRAQAEVAVAHPDPALSDDTLRAIAGEAERLTTMLSDLLALARADAGRRPAAEPVDLVGAVRTALDRLPGDGPVTELVAPAPALVAASPGEIALVLDNLLGNAGRHARSVVRVAVLPAGRWVRLLVDDDGPGIPAADRARIFDRFTRLAPEHSADGGGAGLGLALVDGLVRGRGGTVTAGAAPDGGARLEVRWPAAP